MITGLSEAVFDILQACSDGTIGAEIALMRLILATPNSAALQEVLAEAESNTPTLNATGRQRLQALFDLARQHPEAWTTVRATAAAVPHDTSPAATAETAIARWAQAFDAAARVSPEASVALYSLGDPVRLAQAADEIADWLDKQRLLGPEKEILDIGCGIGRMELALSGRVRRIVGTDISSEMVEIARGRCAHLPNVEIHHSLGRDLAPQASASFDAVLAVDSLPYTVAAGRDLIDTHIREIARVLRPGGDLIAFNYSYRGETELDRADLGSHGAAVGLEMIRGGEQPFRHWDGAIFQLRKTAPPTASRSDSVSE